MKTYLEKHLKIRERDLKYDFMPSMLEIIERPQNALSNVLLFLIVALIITTIVWAKFTYVDITVTSYGVVLPEDGLVEIKSLYGGNVAEVNVKEGEFVSSDSTLLTLDSSEQKIANDEYEHNLKVLKIQRDTYQLIYDKLDGKTKDIKADTSGYGELAYLADDILLENIVYESQLKSIDDENEKETYRLNQKQQVLHTINSIDVQISSEETKLKDSKLTLERMILKAPVSGTVTQMSVVNSNTVLNAGETIGYIVPSDKEIMFTAYVADENIQKIKVNDDVNVKIDAFGNDDNKFLSGKVKSIGSVTVNLDGIGAAYKVEIILDKLPDEIKIGMEGNCDIIIGKRTVLDYFLEPFIEGFEGSLREE